MAVNLPKIAYKPNSSRYYKWLRQNNVFRKLEPSESWNSTTFHVNPKYGVTKSYELFLSRKSLEPEKVSGVNGLNWITGYCNCKCLIGLVIMVYSVCASVQDSVALVGYEMVIASSYPAHARGIIAQKHPDWTKKSKISAQSHTVIMHAAITYYFSQNRWSE